MLCYKNSVKFIVSAFHTNEVENLRPWSCIRPQIPPPLFFSLLPCTNYLWPKLLKSGIKDFCHSEMGNWSSSRSPKSLIKRRQHNPLKKIHRKYWPYPLYIFILLLESLAVWNYIQVTFIKQCNAYLNHICAQVQFKHEK